MSRLNARAALQLGLSVGLLVYWVAYWTYFLGSGYLRYPQAEFLIKGISAVALILNLLLVVRCALRLRRHAGVYAIWCMVLNGAPLLMCLGIIVWWVFFFRI